MTTRYIEDFNECTDPTTGDYLWIVDASAASGDKDRKVNISRFATIDSPTTFARTVNVTSATTSDHGLNVNMPAGATTAARALRVALNSTLRFHVQVDSANNEAVLAAFDNGSSDGPNVQIANNNNASTPAPGYVSLTNRTGTAWRIFPDSSGVLRIHNANPTNAVDVAGTATIVGAQTSHIDYKDVLGAPVDDATALGYIVDAAARVKRFAYKSGAFDGQEFSGIVLDGATLDRYGMDADIAHAAGKALNISTAIGDLFLAVRNLAGRVAALEAA